MHNAPNDGSAPFAAALDATLGAEGGYTNDPHDPGNWTGGSIGRGQCHGTQWGISASAYPQLDIRTLTRDAAASIYRRDFWDRLQCDALHPRLAMLVFDAAVNNGRARACIWLQTTLSVAADGVPGPATLQAAQQQCADPARVAALACEYQARRMDFMARLPGWHQYGLGWARRLCIGLAGTAPS